MTWTNPFPAAIVAPVRRAFKSLAEYVDAGDETLATQIDDINTGLTAGLAGHLADATDAHDASAISYAGGTGMSATNVEDGLDELATEKANQADVVAADAVLSANIAAEAALARNADNLTSGTIADARIPSGITRDTELTAAVAVETANRIIDVEAEETARIAAVAAEAALARNGDNITSGTVPDARIASTIARDTEVTAAVDARLSAANATDLTDGGDSTLHYHAADRARANHTGTQSKSTISDFAHATTHYEGGSDELTPESIGALSVEDYEAIPNDNAAPAVPTGLALTPTFDGFNITWNANTEIDMVDGYGRYRIQMSTTSGDWVGPEVVLDIYAHGSFVTVNGFDPGTYYVRIQAIDAHGTGSGFSSQVSGTTIPIDPDVIDVWALRVDQYIESDDYVAGTSGFRIDGDGHIEMQDAEVRGDVEALSLSFLPTGSALSINGGFETNTTGWSTDGTGTIVSSSDRGHTGSKSLKITNSGPLKSATLTVSNPNPSNDQIYLVDFWAWFSTVDPDSSSLAVGGNSVSSALTDGAWTHYTVPVLNTAASNLVVLFRAAGATTFYLDDVTVTPVGGIVTDAYAKNIQVLEDPSNNLGVVNKGYLITYGDGHYVKLSAATSTIQAVGDVRYLKLAGGTMTGPILAPNGSAAAPSYGFSSDTNCGLAYQTAFGLGIPFIVADGTNVVNFSTGGIDFFTEPRSTITPTGGSGLVNRDFGDARFVTASEASGTGLALKTANDARYRSRTPVFQQSKATGGNQTLSTTSYVDMTGSAASVAASTGDILKVTVHIQNNAIGTAGVAALFDGMTSTGSNYISSQGSAGNGVPAWCIRADTLAAVSGDVYYTVVSGDVSAGIVSIKLRGKLSAAGSKVIRASTTDPLWIAIENISR